ncbi:uncharacterized protein [Ranitomeya imitator]|uniref:uncharacterized protein n=1 Tax=Ranitomeya imitator TaxID=111125 RepID=UPI0037E8AD0F
MWRIFFRQTGWGRRRTTGRTTTPKNRHPISPYAHKELNKERETTAAVLKVINLSDRVLTPTQTQVLEKGLTFAPVASFNSFTMIKDLELFARKLNFKKYFANQTKNISPSDIEARTLSDLEDLLIEQETHGQVGVPTHLHGQSQHFPPNGICPNVDIFVKLVKRDILHISKKPTQYNLSAAQNRAINELKKMKDIVIKPADKGGNVVVWPADMYEREAFKQLNMAHCYRRLTVNPLENYKMELDQILKLAKEDGIITTKMMEGLMVEFPIVPTFYLTPKVHKDTTNPPGRPIVSGIGSLTEKICRYIDFYLQQCVETLPSFIRDTTDILNRLNGIQLEENMYLVTCDVESLYTSIWHDHGIAASRFFLGMAHTDERLCCFILDLLYFSLTHNFFIFKDRYFLQLQGTAMGATCAPSYANLFLGLWEREVVHNTEGIDAVVSWSRYIDDVLFIWQGSEASLNSFLNRLNNNHLNINLTWKYSRDKVEFLDVALVKDGEGFISTNVFRKSTATNALLHATSSHHPQTFKSVPISQFLRIRCICSDDHSFEQQAMILKSNLQQRGYNHKVIRAGYRRAKFASRDMLLAQTGHKSSSRHQENVPVRFITSFNSEWRVISDVLRKHWPVLLADDDVATHILDYPSVTWRRSKNLKDMLTNSHYVAPQKTFFSERTGPRWGSFQCGNCSACQFMERTTTFGNSSGDRVFSITHFINCRTDNVIYFARCACDLIYIGMTTRELRVRILEHVRDIKNGATALDIEALKTIPKHFRKYHNSNPKTFRVRGIDRVQLGIRGGNYKKELLKKETRWTVDLDTLAPKGLNEYISFKSFLG